MTYFPEGGEMSVWRDPVNREGYCGVFRLERFVRSEQRRLDEPRFEWWEGRFVADEFGERLLPGEAATVIRKLVVS